MSHRVNEEVAGRLEETAGLLRDQGADAYRVNAYQRAAGGRPRRHSTGSSPRRVGHCSSRRAVAGRERECEMYYRMPAA